MGWYFHQFSGAERGRSRSAHTPDPVLMSTGPQEKKRRTDVQGLESHTHICTLRSLQMQKKKYPKINKRSCMLKVINSYLHHSENVVRLGGKSNVNL